MNQAEQVIDDLGRILDARYFYNPLLKECSSDFIALTNRCFDEAGPASKESNTRLRELTTNIKPASKFKFYYLSIFGGYTIV